MRAGMGRAALAAAAAAMAMAMAMAGCRAFVLPGPGSSSRSRGGAGRWAAGVDAEAALPLPASPEQQTRQASEAVWAALSDGCTRQIVQLSLPLIGATEMDDWPGGIQQQFKAIQPMLKQLLLGLPSTRAVEDENGDTATTSKARILEKILDDADAVVLATLECPRARDDVLSLVFPTSDSLSYMEDAAKGAGPRLLALVNPQWKGTGEFGLFQRGRAEKFLNDFVLSYSLQSIVIYGYTTRLLKAYPEPWQLFVIDEKTGEKEFVAAFPGEDKPSFDDMKEAVFSLKGKPNAADRVRQSAEFFRGM